MLKRPRERVMTRAAVASAPSRVKIVRKAPREVLRDLRTRAGLSAAEVARKCGYSSTNGYIQYEYDAQADKLIPYRLVKKLLPLFVGRGTPPVTEDELIAITEVRTLRVDAAATPVGVVPSLSRSGLLVVRYRVEAGVYLDATAAGSRVYGESPIAPAMEIEASAQFAAVIPDDAKRTVLHCVKPAHVGQQWRKGRRCVCTVPRGNSGLVEVVLRTYDEDGEVSGAIPVGVVIGAYSRE